MVIPNIQSVSQIRLKMEIPYEFPQDVVFLLVATPVQGSDGFDRHKPPKGYWWGAGGLTPLLPTVEASDAPSPWLIEVLPSYPTIHQTLFLGAAPDPNDELNSGNPHYMRQVTSRFGSLPAGLTLPQNARGFTPGAITPWTDLTAVVKSFMAPSLSVRLALAPYAKDPSSGALHSFQLYAPEGSPSAPAALPRISLDYPNDPVALWEGLKDTSWITADLWTSEGAKGLMGRETRSAHLAWLNGLWRLQQTSAWSPPSQLSAAVHHAALLPSAVFGMAWAGTR